MIRWVTPAEGAAPLARIQYLAVRTGPSLYSQAQRRAWVEAPADPDALAERLQGARVALFRGGADDVGVMTLSPGGLIDMAFVLPAHQRSGVFRALITAVEHAARQANEGCLWTFASLMAQPAFRAAGFSVIHHETVVRSGVTLPRARMEKGLV